MEGKYNLSLHESKQNPSEVPKTKIVEAYGLKKCPKLVEQVADDNIDVRQNSLLVLCDEFKNPFVIQGTCEAGIIKVLSSMVTDPDYITRTRASLALSLAAADANGLEGILLDETIPDILQGMHDPAIQVRQNVYNCLLHCTRTTAGINACCSGGVASAFVNAVTNEEDSLKPVMLKTISNLCKVGSGLHDSLQCHAVKILISLLKNSKNEEICLQAAKTLGFVCFSDEAKDMAIDENAIRVLMDVLRTKPSDETKKAISLALMSITSTDEGKRQLSEADDVVELIRCLENPDRLVRLNVLKVISNISVSPKARNILNNDDTIAYPSSVKTIQKLLAQAQRENDTLLKKHAEVALAAVQWEP